MAFQLLCQSIFPYACVQLFSKGTNALFLPLCSLITSSPSSEDRGTGTCGLANGHPCKRTPWTLLRGEKTPAFITVVYFIWSFSTMRPFSSHCSGLSENFLMHSSMYMFKSIYKKKCWHTFLSPLIKAESMIYILLIQTLVLLERKVFSR